jgi:hypothetical protein
MWLRTTVADSEIGVPHPESSGAGKVLHPAPPPLSFREVVVAGQLESNPNGMMTWMGLNEPAPSARDPYSTVIRGHILN